MRAKHSDNFGQSNCVIPRDSCKAAIDPLFIMIRSAVDIWSIL